VMNLFVILDLGAGRIMTQSLATGDADSALGLLRRSERYLLLVFFAAIVIAGIWNHEITDRLFQISDPGLFDEVHVSLILLVLGILPTFAATLARGIFEGLGNFRIANAIQALNYGGLYFFPLVSLLVTNNLAVICSILLLGRALTLIPFYFLGRKKLKEQSRNIKKESLREHYAKSFWFTLIMLTNPIILYFDRLIISANVPPEKVAYYIIPMDLVLRFSLIPNAVYRVLFPVLSKDFDYFNQEKISAVLRGYKWILLAVLGGSIAVIFLGDWFLLHWLGSDYASQSFFFMKVAFVGVAGNALGYIPYTYLQSGPALKWTALMPILSYSVIMGSLALFSSELYQDHLVLAWSARLMVDALGFYLISVYTIRQSQLKVEGRL